MQLDCQMFLEKYPMDNQTCNMIIGSCEYQRFANLFQDDLTRRDQNAYGSIFIKTTGVNFSFLNFSVYNIMHKRRKTG